MEDTVTTGGRGMTRSHRSATGWRRVVGGAGFALMMLGGLLALSAYATGAAEAEAAEIVTAAAPAGHGFLLVADTAEKRLYVYRVPDMIKTGDLDNVLLGVHLGTFPLPDGRILLSDADAK